MVLCAYGNWDSITSRAYIDGMQNKTECRACGQCDDGTHPWKEAQKLMKTDKYKLQNPRFPGFVNEQCGSHGQKKKNRTIWFTEQCFYLASFRKHAKLKHLAFFSFFLLGPNSNLKSTIGQCNEVWHISRSFG